MANTLKLHIGSATIPTWINLGTVTDGILSYNVEKGDQITLPNYNMVNMKGYILAGWSEKDTRVGTDFVFTKYYEPTENKVDLYPVWVQASQTARTITIKQNISTVTTVKEYSNLNEYEQAEADQVKEDFTAMVSTMVTEQIGTLQDTVSLLKAQITTLEETAISTTAVKEIVDTAISSAAAQAITSSTFILGNTSTVCTVEIPDNYSSVAYKYVIRLEDYKKSPEYTFGTNVVWYNNGVSISDKTPVPGGSVLYGHELNTSSLTYYALPVIEEDDYTLTTGVIGTAAVDYGYTMVKTKSSGYNTVFDSKKDYNAEITQSVDNFGDTVLLVAEPKDGCEFRGWYQIGTDGTIYENGLPGGKVGNPITRDNSFEVILDENDTRYAALFYGTPEYPISMPKEFVQTQNPVGAMHTYASEQIGTSVNDFVYDYANELIKIEDDNLKIGQSTEFNEGELDKTIVIFTNKPECNAFIDSKEANPNVSVFDVEDPVFIESLDAIEGVGEEFRVLFSRVTEQAEIADARFVVYINGTDALKEAKEVIINLIEP